MIKSMEEKRKDGDKERWYNTRNWIDRWIRKQTDRRKKRGTGGQNALTRTRLFSAGSLLKLLRMSKQDWSIPCDRDALRVLFFFLRWAIASCDLRLSPTDIRNRWRIEVAMCRTERSREGGKKKIIKKEEKFWEES